MMQVGTVQRARGKTELKLSLGRSLAELGLERVALAEFRQRVKDAPHDPEGWRELFDHFMAQGLSVSASRVVREVDARGLADIIPAIDREQLGKLSIIPPVSLYVPCFNAVGTLTQVLEAVFAQSICPAQILVVDDCSVDGSGEAAARFPGVEVIRHAENRGLGAARNTALGAARHPLIASLDSDVVAGEFWLERLLLTLADSGCVGVFGALVERNAVALPDRWRARVMPLLYPERGDIDDAVLYGSNTLFTAEALRKVGGYDVRYTRAFDDIDLGNKLRAAGLHIRYVHRAVCEHLRRDDLQAVLRGCYSYRKETARRHRMFEETDILERRWNSLMRDGIAEIEELIRSGARTVIFPSLLNIFWTAAEDLKEFLIAGDDLSRRSYAIGALHAIDRAIGELPGLSAEVVAVLRGAIEPVRRQVRSMCGDIQPADSITAELYERCFVKGAVVLHFAPLAREAFQCGAAESGDFAGMFAELRERIAIVDSGYLLKAMESEWRGPSLPPELLGRCRAARFGVEIFSRASVLRDPRQRAAALRGYQPTKVLLLARGESAQRVAQSYLELREWNGADFDLTVAGGGGALEGEAGVNLSEEEISRILERWLRSS
jgi:GT2 family glycosyltransferase